MQTFSKLLPLVLLSFMISCGGGSGSGSGKNDSDKESTTSGISQNEEIMVDGSNVQGIYATPLWALNYNLHVPVPGHVAIERKGDDFKATVKMKVGAPNSYMRQGIYFGRRCPTLDDDLNKDAFIDLNEAKIAMGLMTIPLDGDLNSQDDGAYGFPIGKVRSGSYFYEQTASFTRMFEDLKGLEYDFSDDVMKIGQEDGITLPGRVVLIQGVSRDFDLPPTVSGAYGMSAHESLPIACGVLWKVGKFPVELQ